MGIWDEINSRQEEIIKEMLWKDVLRTEIMAIEWCCTVNKIDSKLQPYEASDLWGKRESPKSLLREQSHT